MEDLRVQMPNLKVLDLHLVPLYVVLVDPKYNTGFPFLCSTIFSGWMVTIRFGLSPIPSRVCWEPALLPWNQRPQCHMYSEMVEGIIYTVGSTSTKGIWSHGVHFVVACEKYRVLMLRWSCRGYLGADQSFVSCALVE